MSATDALLRAIESHPISIREGADSLALLYWWKREGGDAASFGAAIQSLHRDGLVQIMPGPDMRLRLTAEGFLQLDALLPDEDANAEAAASESEESQWKGGAVPNRPVPLAETVALLVKIFATLAVPAGRAVSADTLSKIWTMEGKRGGDLRSALDAMAAQGELTVQRGERTVFLLTPAGAARTLGAPA